MNAPESVTGADNDAPELADNLDCLRPCPLCGKFYRSPEYARQIL